MKKVYITQGAKEVDITSNLAKKVNITSGFLLLLSMITLFWGLRLTLAVVTAAGIHELGHLAAIWLCGGRADGLRLGPLGAEIRISGRFSYLQDAVIALSGPLAGGLCAATAAAAAEITQSAFARDVCAVSTLYTVFNLIPFGSMDGGRALRALSGQIFGPDSSERICLISDILFSAVLLCAGLYVLFVTGGNYSALLCAVLIVLRSSAGDFLSTEVRRNCCKRA